MRAKPAKNPRRAAGRRSAEPERITQFTLKMRESLHRELARKAFDSGMTMRGFVMSTLKKAGLNVTESDLVDQRRRR